MPFQELSKKWTFLVTARQSEARDSTRSVRTNRLIRDANVIELK